MLSRVASAVYWMARYIERAENTARLINVNTNLVLDTPRGISPGWAPLIMITGNEALFEKAHGAPNERSVVQFLMVDRDNSGSILSSLSLARENARTVRDIVPREAWEEVNNLYLFARDNLQSGLSQRGRYDYLRRIVGGTQQITGLLAGTMSNDHAYNFLRMGRNLERSDMTARIIDVRSASLLPQQTELTPFENIQWMSVLKSLSAYQMYRRHMQARVQRPAVLRFLLQDRSFPRAFCHCMGEVEAALRQLPRSARALGLVAQTQHRVLVTDVGVLVQEALHEYIDVLELALANLDREITATYFTPQRAPSCATASQQ
ncbi:MAG: alpha-E domain-containing protein [Acidiferrobacterales bacterium]